MFLITTADERSWTDDDKILFLGEWCKLYTRKHIWSGLKFEVLPYHWDDRHQMYRDFQYLTQVHERYLNEISIKLNALHDTDHGIRYWRIVVGPWLRFFTDTIFDRYSSLKDAADSKKVTLTRVMPSDQSAWTPKDLDQFYSEQTTDAWNHFIYGQIIKMCAKIPYQDAQEWNHPLRKRAHDQQSIKNKFSVKSAVFRCAKMISKKSAKIVFVSGCFHWASSIRLQLALHQLPHPSWGVIDVPEMPIESDRRVQLKINIATNEFERVLEAMIPWQIPGSYVETYKKLGELAEGHYPDKVRVIYTANAYHGDEGFKIWCAGKVERGVKFVIGQHGGNMGSALMSQPLDHQIAVSDRFYSWGWVNREENNIKLLPACKLVHLKKGLTDPQGVILWVMASFPRYSYCMYSIPMGPQFLNYIDNQIAFSKNLLKEAFDLIQIRLTDNYDLGWNFADRLKDGGLGNVLKESRDSFIRSIKKSRLCIVTHNATALLESFVMDHPTLLFWNPQYYELLPRAKEYFNELRRVGILHDAPESAASLLNKIYDDPVDWWKQPERQAVKDRFCDQFAYVSDDWVQQWKKELLSL